jgi:hypothetical protein
VHADPGMVQAYGDGLKTGKTGRFTYKFYKKKSKMKDSEVFVCG